MLASVAAIVFAVALVLNTMTPSRAERRVWAPVAGVMLICSLAVGVSTGR